MAKAHEARRLKLAQRELVRRKVEQALPITDAERALLGWKGGNKQDKTQDEVTIAAAAKLLIKPQSVAELRILVEKTAAKHHYNPIEGLIELVKSDAIDEKEKIAIHKALLPYLVPQLATPKNIDEKSSGGVKVVITSFSFDPKKSEAPLHAERPKTVETTKE